MLDDAEKVVVVRPKLANGTFDGCDQAGETVDERRDAAGRRGGALRIYRAAHCGCGVQGGRLSVRGRGRGKKRGAAALRYQDEIHLRETGEVVGAGGGSEGAPPPFSGWGGSGEEHQDAHGVDRLRAGNADKCRWLASVVTRPAGSVRSAFSLVAFSRRSVVSGFGFTGLASKVLRARDADFQSFRSFAAPSFSFVLSSAGAVGAEAVHRAVVLAIVLGLVAVEQFTGAGLVTHGAEGARGIADGADFLDGDGVTAVG